MRKAAHLAKLCKAQVCVVVYNGPNAKVKVWPEDQDMAKAIICSYKEAVLKYKGMPKIQKVNLCGLGERMIKELQQKMGADDKELDKLSGESLISLSTFLESKLQKLDDTKKTYC
ncbi:hypothetical protein L3X38_033485 [Prunus dulcis]|uniref:MADS-box domain-containing protein n=1 Tax=Prunus dulcis TaxID=3755 RepID=A0AAD4YVY4_PRUDU|nr:hypothetical protein L3X38_033485 [Prunus dulcis]